MLGSDHDVDLRQESAIPLPSVCRSLHPVARRAAWLLVVLMLLPQLQGCSNSRIDTLHVVVVPLGRMRWLQSLYQDHREWQPLLEKFQALHPRVAVQITDGEYNRLKSKGGTAAATVFHARFDDPHAGVKAGLYYRKKGNPDASDGKVLLQELIRKPMRAKIKVVLPEIGRAVTARGTYGR